MYKIFINEYLFNYNLYKDEEIKNERVLKKERTEKRGN